MRLSRIRPLPNDEWSVGIESLERRDKKWKVL